MGFRDNLISKSILRAIFFDRPHKHGGVLGRILGFFALFQVALARYRDGGFAELRKVWAIDEDEYRESFRQGKKGLEGTGDLGYSGSTFFTTTNAKFLIKSIPRRFESSFFSDDLLEPYISHMQSHPTSLLIRITDFLFMPYITLGGLVGTAPTHHIIMENILYGKEASPEEDGVRERDWETYDLKPMDYFFPERDIAGGALAPDSVIDKLVDDFPDKIRLSPSERANLIKALEADTQLLESANAVDYSLFLVRYPAPLTSSDAPEHNVPTLASWQSSPWRRGITSTDGKWVYRAVVLDFFWAKHKLQAMGMTALVQSFNLFARKGPMSITTTPREYRERFLAMVGALVEAGES